MKLLRTVLLGVVAGVAMTIALFITGAVAARVVYGPGMVPEGKFTADQVSAVYFLWTKLVIGVFFGVLLAVLYEALPLARRVRNAGGGMLFSVLLCVFVYLWGFSHPLVYELRWRMGPTQVGVHARRVSGFGRGARLVAGGGSLGGSIEWASAVRWQDVLS